MITRVVMPKLTDTMEEGVVVAWKKHEGDTVDAGDILAEIETDKAVLDLESFGSGVLRKVLVPEGEAVKAGNLIAVIGEQEEDIDSALSGTSDSSGDQAPKTSNDTPSSSNKDAPSSSKEAPPSAKEAPSSPKDTPAPSSAAYGRTDAPEVPEASSPSSSQKEKQSSSGPTAAQGSNGKSKEDREPAAERPVKKDSSKIKISPRAKKLAEKEGVALSDVTGSGPDGRIVEADIQQRVKSSQAITGSSRDIPLSQMRKAIARVTTSSKAPVPHFYLTTDICMDQAERLRKQMEEYTHTPVSLTVLFVRAAALALTDHPEVNVSYTGEALRRHATVDIGVAVALEDGLITPVIRDCAGKDVRQLAGEIREVFARAKSQQLNPDEYTGATFSISNLGMYEVDNFIAVLMPPQAAAIAIGAVRVVPVVRGKTLARSRRMKVTLSCDHRALDGAQGARFLQSFKRVLEKPLGLFLPVQPASRDHRADDT